MDGDALVREYLGRLDAAASPLAGYRRAELLADVRDHIDAALATAGRRDETTVRNVLERLGAPEEIVAAETGGDPANGGTTPVAVAEQRGLGAIEITALLLLTLGGWLIPLVGPLIGLVFVWMSSVWQTKHKVVATLIVLVVFGLPILGVAFARNAGVS